MTYDSVGNLIAVDGPLAGAADTVRFRYNAARERIGTMGPDPDGAGALKHRAERVTINAEGLVTRVERGTVAGPSDSDWAAFAPAEAVEAAWDAHARPLTSRLTAAGATYALTQTGYDSLGRVECVAQRMNPAAFASPPAGACALGPPGSAPNDYGPDRIARTLYDAAGRVAEVKVALGTPDEATEVATRYRPNGQPEFVTDGEGNVSRFFYDGHDRRTHLYFPSKTVPGAVSSGDLHMWAWDPAGNLAYERRRDGAYIYYSYDALGRLTLKNLPGAEPDVAYGYDLIGRMTSAAQAGHALTFTWDALGRPLTEAGPHGTVSSTWDLAGRRTRLTHPDGFYVQQDFLVTGEVTKIRENGAASGVGVLATYGYDDLGRRVSLTRGNGTVQSYSYDSVSRLAQLVDNPAGTAHDLTLGFAYNPASQIVSNSRSNDLFAWTGHGNGTTATPANGLNQIATVGGTATAHDARGNMTADGLGRTFGYSSQNLLTSASGGVALAYDPAMRLYQTAAASTARFQYDGADLVAEYDAANVLQRRYVHGPGLDEPLAWYEGPGTGDRRFLHADERGSIVAVSNSSGTVTQANTYDEYGVPAPANVGRFQYTGQKWIAELGLYDYKARIYHPRLGRFVQTDPIGYGSGMNLYAYVGGDPVNFLDSSGLRKVCVEEPGSKIPLCREEADEDGDGDTDEGDRRHTRNQIDYELAHPELFYINSPELIAYIKGLIADLKSTIHYCLECALENDLRARAAGRITDNEFNERAWARAKGGVIGASTVGVYGAARAILFAGGPRGLLFGSPYYRGLGRSGFFNYGEIRLGWSYNARTGLLEFVRRVGKDHAKPWFTMEPPPR